MEISKDNALIGAAGVYYVAAELSLRGLIAMPTIHNTAGMDINHWCGLHNYYVFVRYLVDKACFQAFLEPSERVAPAVEARVADERARGLKEFAPCWYLPSNGDEIERLRRQWLEFGLTDE